MPAKLNKRVEFYLNLASETEQKRLRIRYVSLAYKIYLKCRSARSKLKQYDVVFCKKCFQLGHTKRKCPLLIENR